MHVGFVPHQSGYPFRRIFVFILSSPFASAETRHRQRIYQGRVVHLSRSGYVPLQPFTLRTSHITARVNHDHGLLRAACYSARITDRS